MDQECKGNTRVELEARIIVALMSEGFEPEPWVTVEWLVEIGVARKCPYHPDRYVSTREPGPL